jgi:AbiV family abortive infection protein
MTEKNQKKSKGDASEDGWYWMDCDYMSGACYAYENSKKHIFYGEIAGTQKDFGIAVSHLILGIEEMMKSVLLISLYSYEYLLTSQEKRKIFTRHDFKHSNVKELVSSLSEQNIESYHENPFAFFDSHRGNKLQTIAHFLSKGLQLGSLQDQEVKQLADLINKANDLKNRGFYVNYQGKWIVPDEIGKKAFTKYHALSKRLLGYIQPVFTIPVTDERLQTFIEGNWL